MSFNVNILAYIHLKNAQLKFTLEKWRKGEFDVGRNDVMPGYYCILKPRA